MADSAEPKKETVRITFSPQPTAAPAEVPSEKRDTVRINLPTRPSVSPSTNPAQTVPKPEAPAPPPPAPPPVLTPRSGVSPAVTAATTGSGVAATMLLPVTPPTNANSPKKETARITVLPDPPPRSSVQMKKTQPLIDMPAASTPETLLTVAPQARMTIDQIPKPLCWALLGISAAILIIQIWSYFS